MKTTRVFAAAMAAALMCADLPRMAWANTPLNSCCNSPEGCCSPNVCSCGSGGGGGGGGGSCLVIPSASVLTFNASISSGGSENMDLYVPMSDGTYARMMDVDHTTHDTACSGSWACVSLSEFSTGGNGAGLSEPTVNIGKSGETDGSWSWAVSTEGSNPATVSSEIECFNIAAYDGMDFTITNADSTAGSGIVNQQAVYITTKLGTIQPQYVSASQVGNAFTVVLGTSGGPFDWPNSFTNWPIGGYWAGQYVDSNNYPYAYAYSPSGQTFEAAVSLITFYVHDGYGNLLPLTASNYVYSSSQGPSLIDNDSPVVCGFPVWATKGNDIFWQSGSGCTQTGGCPYIAVQAGNNASIAQCMKLKNYYQP